jgi:translocation and assembly module TamA
MIDSPAAIATGDSMHGPGASHVQRLLVLFLLVVIALLWARAATALTLDVKVDGVEGEWRDNVLALLAIYQERGDDTLTEPRLQALHSRAPEQIRSALAPFGLYRVEVVDSLTPPAGGSGPWVATYKITPGDPVKIGSVDYRITGEGADDPKFPKEFPMKVGDVLLHSAYEKAKEQVLSVAPEQGYLTYDLAEHEVLIDPVAYTAHIYFHLETGPRYFFGPVTFKQDLLSDAYLHRFVRFKPGAVYNPERLLSLQGRLLGMEYFDKVEIVPHIDEAGEDRTVPIEVIGTPEKPNKYRVGVGYSTDVGPRFSMDYRRRYLGPEGHKLRADLTISQAIQNISAEYRIPVGNPARDYIFIRPEYDNYDTDSSQGTLAKIEAAYSVAQPGGLRRTIGIDYRSEDYSLSPTDQGVVNELVPHISWAKTSADDPIYTTDGYRFKVIVQGAVEGLVSNASYLQGLASGKYIKSFGKNYRFITRGDIGATWANNVLDLPASRRFYAGGDNSIRGWGFDALGPNEAVTNDTVGGRFLAVGSLELERRIWGNWSAAVFTDFGNAFDPDYPREWEQSIGAGIHWRTPVGQVRVEVAYALTKDPAGFRLHVILGPDL